MHGQQNFKICLYKNHKRANIFSDTFTFLQVFEVWILRTPVLLDCEGEDRFLLCPGPV